MGTDTRDENAGGGNVKWHSLLASVSGVFNPAYLPFDVYTKIIQTLSPWQYQKIVDDKNLYEQLLGGTDLWTIPSRRIKCSCGVWSVREDNGTWNEIDRATGVDKISNLTGCVIKPSKNSSSGIGVRLFDCINGVEQNTGKHILEFLKEYGSHFLIEDKVVECNNLAALNPSSVNTLRIITYRSLQDGIVLVKTYIRIGKKGSSVDNAHAGGITADIDLQNAVLTGAVSLTPYKHFDKTDSGVDIKGYPIEHLNDMIYVATKAHERLPMFDIVGWDIARDNEGRVVILEFNPNPDMRMDQLLTNESFLGDRQQEIVRRVYGTN